MVKIRLSYDTEEEKDKLISNLLINNKIKKIRYSKEGKYKKVYIDI